MFAATSAVNHVQYAPMLILYENARPGWEKLKGFSSEIFMSKLFIVNRKNLRTFIKIGLDVCQNTQHLPQQRSRFKKFATSRV